MGNDADKFIKIHMVEKQLFYAPLYIAVEKYNKDIDEKEGPKLPKVKLIDRNSDTDMDMDKEYYGRDSSNQGKKYILNLLDDLPQDNNSLNLVLTGDLDIYDYLKKIKDREAQKRICLWYIFVNRLPILKIKKDFPTSKSRRILSPQKDTTLDDYIIELYNYKDDIKEIAEDENIADISELLSDDPKVNSAYYTGSAKPLKDVSIDSSFQNLPYVLPFSCIVSNDTEYGKVDFKNGLDTFFDILERSSEELYRLELSSEGNGTNDSVKDDEYNKIRTRYLTEIAYQIKKRGSGEIKKEYLDTIRKVISEFAKMRIWDFNPMNGSLEKYPEYLERLTRWDISKDKLDKLLNRVSIDTDSENEEQLGTEDLHIFYEPYQRIIDNNNYLKTQATKSAIAAVMSRNMSHNWGSHTLIHLGKERYLNDLVEGKIDEATIQYCPENFKSLEKLNEWEKDFYKINKAKEVCNSEIKKLTRSFITRYSNCLRVRMDFLADIFTTAPTSENTRFLRRDLLGHFLDNFILANTISGTSDFKYRFRMNGDDVAVSIPNDILGQDAFSVIIENMIRNTAKHGSMAEVIFDIIIEDGNNIETEDENRSTHKLSDFYKVTIYENCKNGCANCQIVPNQNKLINLDVINDFNVVRDKAWGMLEMKAAATYLRKLPVEIMDGKSFKLDINDENGSWIKGEKDANSLSPEIPYLLKAVCHGKEAEKQGFGYSLFLMKPKEILIFNYDSKNKIQLNYTAETKTKLKNLGITLLQDKDIDLNTIYNHKILLIIRGANFDETSLLDNANKLPKRTITLKKNHNILDKLNEIEKKLQNNEDISIQNEFNTGVWNLWKDEIISKDLKKYRPIGSDGQNAECNSIAIDTTYFWNITNTKTKFIASFGNHADSFFRCLRNHYFDIGTSFSLSRLPKESEINNNIIDSLKETIKKINFDSIAFAESLVKKIGIVDERLQDFAFNSSYSVAYDSNNKMKIPFYILWAYMGVYFPPKVSNGDDSKFYNYITGQGESVNENFKCFYKIEDDKLSCGKNIDLMRKNFNLSNRQNYGTITNRLLDWITNDGKKLDYLIIHLGILEKMFGTDSTSLKKSYNSEIKQKLPNTKIIIISGRGKPENLPSGELFMNYSQIANYVSDNQSKYLLTELCISSRTP